LFPRSAPWFHHAEAGSRPASYVSKTKMIDSNAKNGATMNMENRLFRGNRVIGSNDSKVKLMRETVCKYKIVQEKNKVIWQSVDWGTDYKSATAGMNMNKILYLKTIIFANI
jgi:hypothetical protein